MFRSWRLMHILLTSQNTKSNYSPFRIKLEQYIHSNDFLLYVTNGGIGSFENNPVTFLNTSQPLPLRAFSFLGFCSPRYLLSFPFAWLIAFCPFCFRNFGNSPQVSVHFRVLVQTGTNFACPTTHRLLILLKPPPSDLIIPGRSCNVVPSHGRRTGFAGGRVGMRYPLPLVSSFRRPQPV